MAKRLSKLGQNIAGSNELFCEEHIRHVKGKLYDKPYVLEDWQRQVFWNPIFGMVDRNGHRKYRQALFGFPRLFGKSLLASAALNTLVFMEPIYSGEYGIVASSKEQARIIFRYMSTMVRLDPTLSAMCDVLKDKIVVKETGAEIAVYPAEEAAVQGKHFDVCIIDELHVHKNNRVLEAVQSGQRELEDSLLIIITTAADKQAGVLWDFLQNAKDDPETYIHWIGAGKRGQPWVLGNTQSPHDPKIWEKVLIPSWHSLKMLERDHKKLTTRSFIRYALNCFPADDLVSDPAFPGSLKKLISAKKFDFSGTLSLGIDAAVSGDSFALVYARETNDGYDKTMTELYPIIYDDVGEDVVYDLDQIEQLVLDMWNKHHVARQVADPARMTLFTSHMLSKYGLEIEAFAQNNNHMCPASAHLAALIESDRIRVLGPWAKKYIEHLQASVKVEREPQGWRIGKASRKDKIDGAIAAAMVVMVTEPEDSSDYLH